MSNENRESALSAQSLETMLKDGKIAEFKETLSSQVWRNMASDDADSMTRDLARLNQADRKENPSLPQVQLMADSQRPYSRVAGIELTTPGVVFGNAWPNRELLMSNDYIHPKKIEPGTRNPVDLRLDHEPTAEELAEMLKSGNLEQFREVLQLSVLINMDAGQANKLIGEVAGLNATDRLRANKFVPALTIVSSELNLGEMMDGLIYPEVAEEKAAKGVTEIQLKTAPDTEPEVLFRERF
ncbi:MAG: hypothetical protein JNN26_07670 [Candidatus Obscuribacter sp.]|nr:hypothetical protein [Candidatus Obscuribacter sp.]